MAHDGDTIPDAILRREFFLQRFASFLVNKEVDGTIQSFARKLPSLLNEFGDAEDLTLGERRAVARATTAEMATMWATMWDDITEQLDEMAIMDAAHVAGVYDHLVGVSLQLPADSVILGHIANSVMVLTSGKKTNAGVWSKFIRDNTDTATQSINGAIWNGYTSGQTNQEIVRNIRGTFNRSTKMYQGGILQGSVRAQSESLVRTGTSHFSNGARDRTYAANKDVIQSRILIATLDNRTTFICMRRNLQEWDIDDNSYPRLPFHFNERSVYIVRVTGIDPLDGVKPAVGGKPGKEVSDFQRKFKGRKGTDIFDIKQVAADTSTDAFLRRQPKAFIQSTLGKARTELFLKGGFDVKRFADVTGRKLSLKQLKEIDANAFKKAGLTVTKPKPKKQKPKAEPIKVVKNPSAPHRDKIIKPSEPNKIIDIEDVTRSTIKPPKTLKLNRQQQGEIEFYKGDGFYNMNNTLRDKSSFSVSEIGLAESQRDRIDSIIDLSKTSSDHTFYRGLRDGDLFDNAESLIGKELKNLTTQSTTFDKSIADKYSGLIGDFSANPGQSVVMQINVKKGSSALNVQDVTAINSAEREILLKADSKYVVKSVTDNGSHKIIEVDYIEGD